MLLCGCAALAERPSEDGERGVTEVDAGVAVDRDDGEPEPAPASPRATSGEVVLTLEQASCLELDQAVCAACHRRNDSFVLRPIGVPPSPPGTPSVAREECLQPMPASRADAGIPPVEEQPTLDPPIDPAVEQVLTDAQAVCIGVDQPVCAGCHRRQGSFLLRPRGLPSHPGTATTLLERCL
jgi:hypothetical protein